MWDLILAITRVEINAEAKEATNLNFDLNQNFEMKFVSISDFSIIKLLELVITVMDLFFWGQNCSRSLLIAPLKWDALFHCFVPVSSYVGMPFSF